MACKYNIMFLMCFVVISARVSECMLFLYSRIFRNNAIFVASIYCGDLSVRSLGQICMASSKCISLALCSEIQNVNQAQRLQNKSH